MNLEAVEQGVTIIHACASPQDKKLSTLASLPTPLTSPTPVLELDVLDRQHKKSAHGRLSCNARHLRHSLIVLGILSGEASVSLTINAKMSSVPKTSLVFR